jgi:hypothetical protein
MPPSPLQLRRINPRAGSWAASAGRSAAGFGSDRLKMLAIAPYSKRGLARRECRFPAGQLGFHYPASYLFMRFERRSGPFPASWKSSMNEQKRARRRHDLARMKERAIRVAKVHASSSGQAKVLARIYMKHAEYLKCCSCWLCGNRRRHHGKTIQELRQEFACE